MLRLRQEMQSEALAVLLHPERADKADEAFVGIGLPAGAAGSKGFAVLRPWRRFSIAQALRRIGAWCGMARHAAIIPRMQFTPAPHITQNWHLTKPAASGRRGMVVSQSQERRRGRRRGARCRRQCDRCRGRDRARARGGRAVEFRARRHRPRGHPSRRRGARRDRRFRADRAGRARSRRFKLTGRVATDLFAWPEVEGDTNIHGPLSFVIPSAVAGYAEMHGRWGRLPLADVAAPAIALAQARPAAGLVHDAEGRELGGDPAPYPESARIYLRDGLPPVPPYQGALSYFRLGKLRRHAGAAGAGRLARLLRGRDRGGASSPT